MTKALAVGAALFAAAGILIPAVVVHRTPVAPVAAPLWVQVTMAGCLLVSLILFSLLYCKLEKKGD